MGEIMKTLLTELKYLDAGGDEAPTPAPDALISEMRARIQFLEDELQRKDAILLNMTEVMKAIAPCPRGTRPGGATSPTDGHGAAGKESPSQP